MLALSRGEGQSIIIDGRIEVKIVKWSRSSVRLAIQAPREVSVDRDEIWRRSHPGQPTPLELVEQNRHPPAPPASSAGPSSPTAAPGGPSASLPPSSPATGPSAAPPEPPSPNPQES